MITPREKLMSGGGFAVSLLKLWDSKSIEGFIDCWTRADKNNQWLLAQALIEANIVENIEKVRAFIDSYLTLYNLNELGESYHDNQSLTRVLIEANPATNIAEVRAFVDFYFAFCNANIELKNFFVSLKDI